MAKRRSTAGVAEALPLLEYARAARTGTARPQPHERAGERAPPEADTPARGTTPDAHTPSPGTTPGAHDPSPGTTPEVPPDPPPAGVDGHRARMRTRLLTAGPEALNAQDLLEMLLFLALPRRDTKPIARTLLARFGGFGAVIAAPVPELLAIEGMGEAGAAALKTVQAAALALLRGKVLDQPLLTSWDRLLDYLRAALAHARVEQTRVLFLDSRNRLVADEVQGQGTINRATVFPREVARRALELHATAVILVHNHPSGDPTPSGDDVIMTRAVRAALDALGIVLHDHLVVGATQITSFRRDGLL